MTFATAFQSNAFQTNAFQIAASTAGLIGRRPRRYRRRIYWQGAPEPPVIPAPAPERPRITSALDGVRLTVPAANAGRLQIERIRVDAIFAAVEAERRRRRREDEILLLWM